MGDDRQTDAETIARATRAALEDAESIGLKSIAFPALGTGVGGMPYEEAAAAMLGQTVKYLSGREAPRLKRVVFFLYDDAATEGFRKVLSTMRENP
jgi:O-acetyl-ADP-ribose deacetylase (regulator of RNase III)